MKFLKLFGIFMLVSLVFRLMVVVLSHSSFHMSYPELVCNLFLWTYIEKLLDDTHEE